MNKSVASRVAVLDTVRGFALFGILLINVEFFVRPVGERGPMVGATALDNWLGTALDFLVEGKVWIIFSLLFGIGFALTLQRASASGGKFVVPYLRRVAALAFFGAVHGILIWRGDILYLYAVSALALLLLLFAKWYQFGLAAVSLLIFGVITGLDPKGRVVEVLGLIGLVAVYIRNERRVAMFGKRINLVSLGLGVAGLTMIVAATAIWLSRGSDVVSGRLLVRGIFAALLGLIAHLGRNDRRHRILVGASCLYAAPMLLSLTLGVLGLSSAPRPNGSVPTTPVVTSDANVVARGEPSERLPSPEAIILSGPSYSEGVVWRAAFFWKNMLAEAGLLRTTVAVFLIGFCLVEFGVFANPAGFRRTFLIIAVVGIPIGYITTTVGKLLLDPGSPGVSQLANNLVGLGSLVASLGVFSLLNLAANRDWFSGVQAVLSPVGLMSLTNYILQSVVCGVYFYGCGFGHTTAGRTHQILFAMSLFVGQVILSHLWLRRFRLGPLEWIWRVLTHGRLPRR